MIFTQTDAQAQTSALKIFQDMISVPNFFTGL